MTKHKPPPTYDVYLEMTPSIIFCDCISIQTVESGVKGILPRLTMLEALDLDVREGGEVRGEGGKGGEEINEERGKDGEEEIG